MDSVLDPRNRALILDKVRPIVPLLHEAAEYGTERARTYFHEQAMPSAQQSDDSLFAHLVRHQVNSFLNERGQVADVDRHWLANSGVAFTLDWIEVRFLKSFHGRLPAPGPSRTKRAFYRQVVEQGLWDERPSFQRVNLVMTWDIDDFGNLAVLHVYSPSGGGNAPDSARSFWSEALEHPAVTFQVARPVVDDPDEALEEIDIWPVESESPREDEQPSADGIGNG